MTYTRLGATGPKVSRVAVGSFELSNAWGDDVSGAGKALRRAADLGVNFFDTARGYGFGVAESGLHDALGDLLRRHRDDFVISTKGGIERCGEFRYRNAEPAALRRDLTDSLADLQLEHVDVFLVHWPDPTVPPAEVSGGLRSLVDAGLTRMVGVSNVDLSQLTALGGGDAIDVVQLPYNLFRSEADRDVIPYCLAEDIAIMGYAPLAQGLLAGAFRADQPPVGDWRALEPEFQGERFAARMRAVEPLREQAEAHSCTLPQLALAWVLANPVGVIPVFGAQHPAEVDDSLRALRVQLSAEQADALSAMVARIARDPWLPSTRTPMVREV